MCMHVWWFVLRGEESTLQNLESCWNQLELQTKWKLEPVLRYSDAVAGTESDRSTESDRPIPPTTEEIPVEPTTETASTSPTTETICTPPSQEVPITNEVRSSSLN